MTPEAQRIAIAEFCGWTPTECGRYEKDSHGVETRISQTLWHKNGDPMTATLKLPDFLNDLNAVHEAEEMLSLHQSDRYARALACANNADQWTSHFRAAHATAAQRCEAILKTIGKWVEE